MNKERNKKEIRASSEMSHRLYEKYPLKQR